MSKNTITDFINLFEENGFVFVESKYQNLSYKVVDIKNKLRTILFVDICPGEKATMRFNLVQETNKIVRGYNFKQIIADLNRISKNNVRFLIDKEFDQLFVTAKIIENLDRIKEYLADLKMNPNNGYKSFLCEKIDEENGNITFKMLFGCSDASYKFFCTSKGFYAM